MIGTTRRASTPVRLIVMILGLLTAITAWWWVASSQPAYVLPGPADTWSAVASQAREGRLWGPLATTLLRTVIGMAIAIVVGLAWGAVCAVERWVDLFTKSWLSLLMAVPPIVIVVIGMLGFGPDAKVVVLVIVLVTIPLLTTTCRDAIAGVDLDLLEMAHVFGRSSMWRWCHVIVPSVAPPVLSAVTVAAGQSIRIAVMAELLVTSTGLGAQMQRARVNLDTADVFAQAVVLALVALGIDAIVLTPLRNRMARMGSNSSTTKGMQ